MDWKTENTLRTYLLQKMHYQYDVRRDVLRRALESKETITDYKELCRKKYIHLLGEIPVITPLNPLVMSRTRHVGYSVENVIYESRPGHHVTSNLYLPDGTGSFPAVLMFCGHEMSSKATESYQKTAILFATNGFVVLVVDPISQGERVQFTDSLGTRILRGSTTEHTLLNAGANLVGTNIVAWELFDNIRSLDYLSSRPEVDADRIGCLGNSGGGAQTAYFIGFDDRIKVAAPCSNIASRERNYELSGVGDGCQQIPFEGREQLEIADFLIMFAPKPLLVLAGRYDFVDYTGTEIACKELTEIYSGLNEPGKLRLFTADDGHGISKPKREEAVTWFRQWLCSDTTHICEGDITLTGEKQTLCTPTGQVNSFFAGERDVQDFHQQRANDLEGARIKFLKENDDEKIRKKIREVLALGDENFVFDTEVVSVERHPGYIMRKLIIRRKGEVPLPCLSFIPDRYSLTDTLILWLSESGKSEIASDMPQLMAQIEAGNPVFLADLRGMGETAESDGANEWKYYNREYHNAIISLHIGKPLTGQRVEDIFTILKFIAGEPRLNRLPLKIKSSGPAGPAALYAALFDTHISEIEVSGSIRSYKEILEKPMEKDWYSYVLPYVLCFFDLPDLVRMRPELIIKYR